MRPQTACPRARSIRSSRRCAASGTGSRRCAACTSRRRTGNCGRSGYRHGQTSWSARWYASCWKRTISRSFLIIHMVLGKGGHTALREVQKTWTGTVWFIEGDISDCFGSTDHEILLGILAGKIRDNRFLRLIRNMLKAGYMEDWQHHDTLSGTPQGGVVSPVLSLDPPPGLFSGVCRDSRGAL